MASPVCGKLWPQPTCCPLHACTWACGPRHTGGFSPGSPLSDFLKHLPPPLALPWRRQQLNVNHWVSRSSLACCSIEHSSCHLAALSGRRNRFTEGVSLSWPFLVRLLYVGTRCRFFDLVTHRCSRRRTLSSAFPPDPSPTLFPPRFDSCQGAIFPPWGQAALHTQVHSCVRPVGHCSLTLTSTTNTT